MSIVRIFVASAFVLGAWVIGCSSSGGTTPEGACTPSDPSCVGATDSGHDSHVAVDTGSGSSSGGNVVDASADATCTLKVDDAGVSHGCGPGDNGPGDRDEGGDAGPPPPPDASRDATDLPLGAPCWDNAQCASGICFDYAVKGQFCTQRCWTDDNCPPPMDGCNGMGVCRVTAGP